jgi:hypothetical protein
MAKASNRQGTSAVDTDRRGDNAATEARDSDGKFTKTRTRKLADVDMPDITARNAALGALGAGLAVAAVAAGSALFKGWAARKDTETATDNGFEQPATAALTPADVIDDDKREAFAPATMPVPSRIEAMGNGDD